MVMAAGTRRSRDLVRDLVPAVLFAPLRTAGMRLLDALDGIFMSRAYGWAFLKPVRKVYYN